MNLDCLGVCLFVFSKRQNGWTDRAQIVWGNSRDPREGLWIIKILKFVFKSFYFCKNLEMREKILWYPYFFLFFYTVKREMLRDKARIKSWNRR